MKKFVALLLAAMMLLGSVAAFAAGETWDVREDDDRYTSEDVNEISSPKTELWLQVDADGQIDVTVPLVLVFKTNIDGGHAQEATNYAITNHSSANVAVTKIAVNHTNNPADKMTIEPYGNDNTVPTEDDHYAVKLTVAAANRRQGEIGVFDLNTTAHEIDKALGGNFVVAKNDGVTTITVDMKTGPLTFVTQRTTNENGEDTGMDNNMGVKLLTVTYTVAIDTSEAIGVEITTTPNNPTPSEP